MNKKIKMGLLLSLGVLLVGCGNEEKELADKAKEEFKVLYTYDESKIMPVIKEEKTPEQLAEDYLMDRIGLKSSENPTYAEQGVLEGQGIFVESAIYDGGRIPNVSAMDKETKERLKSNREDRSMIKKQEEYKELIENRQNILADQYKDDNTNKDQVEDEIKKQVEKYKQDNEDGAESEETETVEDTEETEENFEYEDE